MIPAPSPRVGVEESPAQAPAAGSRMSGYSVNSGDQVAGEWAKVSILTPWRGVLKES